MSERPAPPASRLARARWRDPRLLVGVVLVLLPVAIGARVVAEADERVQVWSVTRDLGAGATLAADDLAVRAVRLDATAERYLAASEDLTGFVLTRAVGRDELLPLAAVARVGSPDRRRVVVEVDRVAATGLAKGRVVDLYVVRDAVGSAAPPPPELVLAGVTVGEDLRGAGGFGGGGATAGVTLLVEDDAVPAVIEAMASGSVHVVQVDR